MADFGQALADLTDSMRRSLTHSDVVLDGINYILWKLTIRRILDGLRVLGLAEGSTSLPVAPYLPDASDSSVADDDMPSSLSSSFRGLREEIGEVAYG